MLNGSWRSWTGVGGTKEDKLFYLVLAYSEAGPKLYNTNHNDGGKTVGICGVVKSFWGEHLKEKGIPINSLTACAEIFNYYLEQNNYNHKEALKDYKGIKSKDKMWIIQKVFRVKNELEKLEIKTLEKKWRY